MNNSYSITFTKTDKIIVSSSDETAPLVFESHKQLDIIRDPSKDLFESFKDSIEEWISRIEIDKDFYSLIHINPTEQTHGGIIIRFKNTDIARLFLLRSNIKKIGNRKVVANTVSCVDTLNRLTIFLKRIYAILFIYMTITFIQQLKKMVICYPC